MKSAEVNIAVNLSDIITPKSCSELICSLIKHLLYQQEQIPYTYERLKYLITKRKELMAAVSNEQEDEKTDVGGQFSLHSRIAAERNFRKAEETFLNLESAFKDIRSELQEQSSNAINEVLIILGNTPLHPRNIFRILIPVLSLGHKEENHPSQKYLPSLFQALVSSEELHKALNKKVGLTNVFILLKTSENLTLRSETFHLKSLYEVPVRTLQITFNLKTTNIQPKCSCLSESGIPIFCDTPAKHSNTVGNVIYSQPRNEEKRNVGDILGSNDENGNENEVDDDCNWYQFNCSIKGFKDCKIDGIPASNIWLKCTHQYDLMS